MNQAVTLADEGAQQNRALDERTSVASRSLQADQAGTLPARSDACSNNNRPLPSKFGWLTGGFTLIELLIALSIIGAGAALTLSYYLRGESNRDAQATGVAIDYMATRLRQVSARGATYYNITAADVNRLGLVTPPLRWDGANILDPRGNLLQIQGNDNNDRARFALLLTGAAIAREDCVAIATATVGNAWALNIGSGVFLDRGLVAAGWAYKANNGAPWQGALSQCSVANTRIGFGYYN